MKIVAGPNCHVGGINISKISDHRSKDTAFESLDGFESV